MEQARRAIKRYVERSFGSTDREQRTRINGRERVKYVVFKAGTQRSEGSGLWSEAFRREQVIRLRMCLSGTVLMQAEGE